MDSKKKDEIIRTLEQYVPIKREIKMAAPRKLAEFIEKLLKSENEMQAYMENPLDSLQKAGIDPEEVTIDMLASLAIFLKERQISRQSEEKPDSDDYMVWKKETQEATIWQRNNDREQSWYYEWAWKKSEGLKTNKDKSSYLTKTKKISGEDSKINPKLFWDPEIREFFFPAQPLVTPELIKKIKDMLDKD